MKRMKKLVGLLLTMVMVLSMTMTAFAANITISGGASGSEYAAYKLLNATNSAADKTKFAYTVNEKYLEILKAKTGKTAERDIIGYIEGLDDDDIRTFANSVYEAIKTASLNADVTTANNKFADVDQGYYLIAETKVGDAQDTFSLVMLDTAGIDEITVKTKEDVPSLEKKVQEKDDSTGETSDWQDGADYDIGDDVPFKLTGTVSAKYADYKTYYYAFHDKMSPGLSFNANSVVVKIDGTVIDSSNYDLETEDITDKCTFEVVFNNLKEITEVTVDADSVITVEFTAKLTGDAVEFGNPGNPNEAKLVYNNNPYYDGDGKPEKPGETPWDKVVVFTYILNTDKVDEDSNALAGAGFTLYKWDDSAKDGEGDWVAVGSEITGVTTFTFKGLDAGKYKLVESKVPAGYNKADDVCFVIEAAYDTSAEEPKLNTLVVKDENGNVISEGETAVFNTLLSDGTVSNKVVNQSGTVLPETGGMGTTLFYVFGTILVAGAAVMLITKKRMSGVR